ncbi:hypothetical protein ACIQU5_11695 [Streptomyces sp. NPDC090306]|uniref:hypothetical protein n=1 Tax=Streptomyces sp. NPDC090306 TaxID=3365961 RepID=UPI0037FB3CFA
MSTRAVVVGLGKYEAGDFEPLPTAAASAEFWHALFTAPDGWGLPPEHCQLLLDTEEEVTTAKILRAVTRAAAEAVQTLAFVYCGHAFRDERQDLRLVISGEPSGNIRTWGLEFTSLMRAVHNGSAHWRLAVLDCCYAGAATSSLNGIGSAIPRNEVHEGTFLACAAEADVFAPSTGSGGTLTGFTQTAREALEDFREAGTRRVEAGAFMEDIRRRHLADGRQPPYWNAEGSAGRIPIIGTASSQVPRLPPEVTSRIRELAHCVRESVSGPSEHAPAVLRIERPPHPGHAEGPFGVPSAGELPGVLSLLPRDTDVPLCLLARYWAALEPDRGAMARLSELARVCRTGTRPSGSESDERTLVLTLDPALVPAERNADRMRALVRDFLKGAASLVPPRGTTPRPLNGDERSASPRWTRLRRDRSACGSSYLLRRLPQLVAESGEGENPARPEDDPGWLSAALDVVGHPGPVAAAVQTRGIAPPWSARLARCAHLLRAEDGERAAEALLIGRVTEPAALPPHNRPPEAATHWLRLLVPDDEPPGVHHVYAAHRRPAEHCALSADERLAVSADGTDGYLHLWDPRTGEPLRRIGVSSGRITAAALVPGTWRVLTVCDQGRVVLTECREPATTLAEVRTTPGNMRRHITVSGDCAFVTTSQGVGVLRIGTERGAGRGLEVLAHLTHPGTVACVVSPMGEKIAVLVVTDQWRLCRWTITPGATGDERAAEFHARFTLLATSTRCGGGGAGPATTGGRMPVTLIGRFPDRPVRLDWHPVGDPADPTQVSLLPEAGQNVSRAPAAPWSAIVPAPVHGALVLYGDGGAELLPKGGRLPVRSGSATAAWSPGPEPYCLTFDRDGRIRAWAGTDGQAAAPGVRPVAEGIAAQGEAEHLRGRPVGIARDGAGAVVARDDGSVSRHEPGLPAIERVPSTPGLRALTATSTTITVGGSRGMVFGLSDGSLAFEPLDGTGTGGSPPVEAHNAAVTTVTGHPGPSHVQPWLLSVSRTGELRTWRTERGLVPAEADPPRRLLGAPALACTSAHGTYAVAASPGDIVTVPAPGSNTQLSVQRVAAGWRTSALCTDPRHDDRVLVAGSAPSGQAAAGVERAGAAQTDTRRTGMVSALSTLFPGTGEVLGPYPCREHSEILALAVDPASGLVAACDVDGLVTVRDRPDASPSVRHRVAGTPVGIVWLPEGRLAVVGSCGVALLALEPTSSDGAHRSVPPDGPDGR